MAGPRAAARTTCAHLHDHLQPERNPWQRPESTDLTQYLPPIPSCLQLQLTLGQRGKRESLNAIREKKPISTWSSDAEAVLFISNS